MEIFRKRFKELRAEKGLSFSAISKALNLSYQTVARWENGERLPSLETLVKIANYFGVTTDYLLGRTDY